MRALAVILAVLVLAAGCGQKGPLYLRDEPPPGVKPKKSDTYKPEPYPAESDEATEKK